MMDYKEFKKEKRYYTKFYYEEISTAPGLTWCTDYYYGCGKIVGVDCESQEIVVEEWVPSPKDLVEFLNYLSSRTHTVYNMDDEILKLFPKDLREYKNEISQYFSTFTEALILKAKKKRDYDLVNALLPDFNEVREKLGLKKVDEKDDNVEYEEEDEEDDEYEEDDDDEYEDDDEDDEDEDEDDEDDEDELDELENRRLLYGEGVKGLLTHPNWEMVIQSEPKTEKDFEEILMKAGFPMEEIKEGFHHTSIWIMKQHQKMIGPLTGLTLKEATTSTDSMFEGSLLN